MFVCPEHFTEQYPTFMSQLPQPKFKPLPGEYIIGAILPVSQQEQGGALAPL